MALSRGNIKYNSRNIQFVPNTTAAAIYVNPATTKTYIKGFIILEIFVKCLTVVSSTAEIYSNITYCIII